MQQPRARCQQELFQEPPAVPAVRLPLDVQEQPRQALVQFGIEAAIEAIESLQRR